MKIVIPIADSDANRINLFAWAINEHGPYPEHELLVVASKDAQYLSDKLYLLIQHNFGKKNIESFEGYIEKGWPIGPNIYWKKTIELLRESGNTSPWLWMETDLVPLREGWIDTLEAEYKSAGKPFMGAIESNKVRTRRNVEAKSGEHMVGIGVYPPEVEKYISDWEFIDDIEKAFDWVLGWQIAPQTHDGGLILNSYRTRDYRIEDGKVTCNNINTSSNSHDHDRPITSKTILHHGCKDQSIVRLMQEGQIPHG